MSRPNTVRVLIYREGEVFIAQGLEVDICAQGDTPEVAKRRFGIALRAEAEEAWRHNRDLFDAVGPAPSFVHAMFDNECFDRTIEDVPQAA